MPELLDAEPVMDELDDLWDAIDAVGDVVDVGGDWHVYNVEFAWADIIWCTQRIIRLVWCMAPSAAAGKLCSLWHRTRSCCSAAGEYAGLAARSDGAAAGLQAVGRAGGSSSTCSTGEHYTGA